MGSRVDRKKKKSNLIPVAEWAAKVALSRSYVYRIGRLGMIEIKDGMVDPAAAEQALGEQAKSERETFHSARARKESALASLRELELRIKAGSLVDVEAMKKMNFELGAGIKDKLLSIPDRVSGLLAVETDQLRIKEILTKEITVALEGLNVHIG